MSQITQPEPDDANELEQLIADYYKMFGEGPPWFHYPDVSEMIAVMKQALKTKKLPDDDVPDDIVL